MAHGVETTGTEWTEWRLDSTRLNEHSTAVDPHRTACVRARRCPHVPGMVAAFLILYVYFVRTKLTIWGPAAIHQWHQARSHAVCMAHVVSALRDPS